MVALVASSAPIGYVQAETVEVVYASHIDEATLECIFEAVACETGMCIDTVREQYTQGEIIIEKQANGYRVMTSDGGSILENLLEDNL